MKKIEFDVILKVVGNLEMNEEDVRLELEIYDDSYIPTIDDWKQAVNKRIQFLLDEDYFMIENYAEIKNVDVNAVKETYD